MTRKLTKQEISDLMWDFTSAPVEDFVQAIFNTGFAEGLKENTRLDLDIYDGDGNTSYLRGYN